jgi:hypothetical protein
MAEHVDALPATSVAIAKIDVAWLAAKEFVVIVFEPVDRAPDEEIAVLQTESE